MLLSTQNATGAGVVSTSPSEVVADFAAAMGDGFYTIRNNYSGVSTSGGGMAYTISPYFSKTSSSQAGIVTESEYSGTFAAGSATQAWDTVTDGNSSYALTANGWKQYSNQYSYTLGSAGSVQLTELVTGQSFAGTLLSQDVVGKTLWDLAGATTDINSTNELTRLVTILSSNADVLTLLKNTPLPAGSKVLGFKGSSRSEVYWSLTSPYYCAPSICASQNFSSLSSLIETYKTAATNSGNGLYFYTTNGTLYGTFDAGGTDSGGTLSLWKYASSAVSRGYFKQIETTRYEIRTVHGQQIMVITTPPSVLAARTQPQGEQIFALHDGKVYSGAFNSGAVQNSDDPSPSFNKLAAAAIFKILGWPSVDTLSGKTVTGAAGVVAEVTKTNSTAAISIDTGLPKITTTNGITTSTRTTYRYPSANVVTGWNLLGHSNIDSINPGATLGDNTKVITVWKWNASTSKWAFYTPMLEDGGKTYAASKGYDFLIGINTGEGFWVNAASAFPISMGMSPAFTLSMTVNAKDSIITQGTIISVALKDENGLPSVNQVVSFQDRSGLLTLPQSSGVTIALTDAQGVAQIMVSPKSANTVGSGIIEASLSANSNSIFGYISYKLTTTSTSSKPL